MGKVIAVVGATANGKSALALDIAAELLASGQRAEIINADALALYRGMDIGTAKTPPDQRRGIPHHQLDVLDPLEDAAVAAYQRHARRDTAAVHARGAVAVVVGGSGLYVQALLDEMDFPPTDPAVRRALEERARHEGAAALHAELTRKDPRAAASIEPANVRRVVRALEVMELTGRPFSATLPEPRHHYEPTIQLGLAAASRWLDERIAQRTEAMLAAGIVAETVQLGTLGRTASRATGYSQVLEHLRGDLAAEELAPAITLATRQLARRQVKWFRRDPRTTWFDAADPAALARARKLALDRAIGG